MVEAILSYVIKAIDESSSVMDRIKSSVGLLGSSLSELGGGFASVGSVMTGFAAGGVAGAAISALGQVAQGLEWSIKEAADSEAVFTSLGAAVERSGTAWASVSDGTKQALLAMQATTTYSDEQLAAALEKMLTFGLSYDDAMKALGATIDFAAAKHMDLESAATLVGKAVDGNTAIMKRYGVDITVAKDATDKFTPVLTALNEQFGGAAQAQANTYAGIQERLKNATSELGEKIGRMVLPALASMTEGMIPVVDQLGKGVDALSAWLTEVGKMPEVQGAVTFLGEAFNGLMGYLQDLWSFIVDHFGPVLTELMGAFKELWDALSPIGEAIGELMGAFGDTGNIDLLKIAIQAIVFEIRGIVTIIKEVAPYIKQFADAFKAAADFMTPILTQIVTSVRAFLDELKIAFQGFYTWLVGGSLWTDMWNQMLRIASTMIAQLMAALTAKFLDPLKTAFTGAVDALKTTWDTGWQSFHTTFTTITGQIGTSITTQLEAWKTSLSISTSQYAPIATQALAAMQSSVNTGMALIKGDWQGALDSASATLTNWGATAKTIMDTCMGLVKGAVDAGVSAIERAFNGLVGAAQTALGQVQAAFAQAQSLVGSAGNGISQAVTNTAQTIVQVTQPATNTFQSLFNQAASGVISAGQQLYNMLVGHSIWPDMMGSMESITSDAMTSIKDDVMSGFREIAETAKSGLDYVMAVQQKMAAAMAASPTTANVQATYAAAQAVKAAQGAFADWQAEAAKIPSGAGTIPAGTSQLGALEYVKAWEPAPANQSAFWVPSTPMNMTGVDMASYAQKLADAIQASRVTNATLPVSVVIDGVTVSRVVEKRLVNQYQAGSGY